MWGASCTMEIDRRECRSYATWRVFSPLCPHACARSSLVPMLASIVGTPSKPMRKRKLASSSWRAKPDLCWRNCKKAHWQPSCKTDADQQCEFWYQPGNWGQAYRFIALRYKKENSEPEREQYQLFESPQYRYRVFVTNLEDAIDLLVWFYNERAGAENLIKEANNDAGLAAHPSGRWNINCVHFQLVMLAYNLNCWLLLFQREEESKVGQLQHTTMAIARLRFLFLAAKMWRHAGRVGISYSDQYAERGLFHRLMNRLRRIAPGAGTFLPVLATALVS